jgi:hypothetical protein
VQHIGHWYAQAHPTEDFAETFAVWLQPRARWRREYAGWPALRKLEYVDTLMTEIAGRRPPNQDRSTAAGLQDNRRRLRDHYRRSYAPADLSERRYDAWLYRNFVPRSIASSAERASTYLRSIEPELRAVLTRRADTGSYLAAHVTATLRRRVRELDLAVNCGRREAKRRAVRLHERVIVDLLHRNRESYLL